MYNVYYAVKKALADGMLRKRYRFNVLRDDGTTEFTIGNDNLVAESVTIEESMCSDDTIKFGLCEGSSIDFQFFGLPNIYGRRFQAFLDIEYSANTWATIPMGYFEVVSCSRQASTGIMKITAFNKLQSKYLNAEAKNEVKALVEAGAFGQTGSITMYKLLDEMLNGYHIKPDPEQKIEQTFTLTPVDFNVEEFPLYSPTYPYPMVSPKLYWVNLNLAYTFPLNTIDDYYRVTLNLRDMASKTMEFVNDFSELNPYWVEFPGMGEPMKLNEAIELMDEVGLDRSYGNLFYGTVKITRADDHTKTLFDNRLQILTEEDFLDYIVEPNNEDYANCYQIVYSVPVMVVGSTTHPTITMQQLIDNYNHSYGNIDLGEIYNIILSDANMYTITSADVDNIENVTLRDLQSAVFEMQCQFGQINRVTDLFAGVELNSGGLYPAADLYPSDSLYPAGAAMTANKSMYSTLWADEGNIRKWKYLIITYTGLDENNEKVEKRLQRTINADGTDNYNMSDNWLFLNLVWTAEEVGAYADAMVLKMKDITWFPFEMWLPGLPYLETGDMIEVPVGDYTYKTYILQRSLKGIQNLQDTYINGTLDIF